MEYNFDENPLRLLMDNILEIISRWDQVGLQINLLNKNEIEKFR